MKDISGGTLVIQGWMVQDLQLKGNELMVFAIIHNITQDGTSQFYGSLDYLASWCNATKQGIIKNLDSLVSKGFITKIETANGLTNNYITNIHNETVKQSLIPVKQSLIEPLNKVECSVKQSLPNNINILKDNNKDNIKNSVQSTKSSKSKISKKDKILKMVEKKCFEYDIVDDVIDKLFEFYSVLLENNKLVSEQKVNADLSNLAKVNYNKQLQTINEALKRGWTTLEPKWLENTGTKGQSKNTLIHHEQKIADKNKSNFTFS